MHDATDERDKIFAILGLVEGGQPFQADYRKTLAEVHYDALNTLFKDRSDFEFLTWLQYDGNTCEGMAGWPSWLPKGWTYDVILGYQFASFNMGGRYPFDRPTVKISRTEAEIPGFRVFYIEKFGLSSRNSDENSITHTLNQTSNAWDIVRQNEEATRTAEFLFQNFLWTLLCGSIDAAEEHPSAKSGLRLWDDQFLVDFADFWHFFYLLAKTMEIWYPSWSSKFPVIESILLAMHCVATGSPFPDPGDVVAFSETFQSKIVSFLKQRYPQIWIRVAEYVRGEILACRPTAAGVDVATEMLAPLLFLDPMGDDTRFWKRFRESSSGRRFFITNTGHIGMGPEKYEKGAGWRC